jgi:hypothetical protein
MRASPAAPGRSLGLRPASPASTGDASTPNRSARGSRPGSRRPGGRRRVPSGEARQHRDADDALGPERTAASAAVAPSRPPDTKDHLAEAVLRQSSAGRQSAHASPRLPRRLRPLRACPPRSSELGGLPAAPGAPERAPARVTQPVTSTAVGSTSDEQPPRRGRAGTSPSWSRRASGRRTKLVLATKQVQNARSEVVARACNAPRAPALADVEREAGVATGGRPRGRSVAGGPGCPRTRRPTRSRRDAAAESRGRRNSGLVEDP